MSDLSYGNVWCLLYQINISGFDMIMPFPLCRHWEECIWCSIPLRAILICSWPESSIAVLGAFTHRDQLSSAVQCYTSVACNIYHATDKGASWDITVANDSPALAMNQSNDRRRRAQRKKILHHYNKGTLRRYRQRVFKSAIADLNNAATLHIYEIWGIWDLCSFFFVSSL